MVNPSDLSLPVISVAKTEGDSRGNEHDATKSALTTMQCNPSERTVFRSISLFVVVATATTFATFGNIFY
jgi:hypothetical protein